MTSKRMSISSLLSNDPPATPARSEPLIQSVPAQPEPRPAPPLKRARQPSYSQQYYESYNAYPYNVSSPGPNSPNHQQYYQSSQQYIEDHSMRPSPSSSNAHRNPSERPLEPTRPARTRHMQQISPSEDAVPHPSSRGVEHPRGHHGWPPASQGHTEPGVRMAEDRWREQGNSNYNVTRDNVGSIPPRQAHAPHQLSPGQAALPPPQLRREAVQQSHENVPYSPHQVQRHRQQEAPFPAAVLDRRPPRPNVRLTDTTIPVPLPGPQSHPSNVHLHSTGHPYTSSQRSSQPLEYISGPSPVRPGLHDFPPPGMRHEVESPSSYTSRISRTPTQLIAPLSLSNLPRQIPHSPTMTGSPYQGSPQIGPNQQSTVYSQQSQSIPPTQHHTRPPSSPHVPSSLHKGHILTFPSQPASPQATTYSNANQPPRHLASRGSSVSETEQGPLPFSRVPETETRRSSLSRSSESEPRRPSSSRSMDPPRLLSSRKTESPRPRSMESPRPILSRPPSTRDADFAIPPPPPNAEFACSAHIERPLITHNQTESSLTRPLREADKVRPPVRGPEDSPVPREGGSMFIFSLRSLERGGEHPPSPHSLAPVIKPGADIHRPHQVLHTTLSVDNDPYPKMHPRVGSSPTITASPQSAELTASRPPSSSDKIPSVGAAQFHDLAPQQLKREDDVKIPPRVRPFADLDHRAKSPPLQSDPPFLQLSVGSAPVPNVPMSPPLQQTLPKPPSQPALSHKSSNIVQRNQLSETEILVKETGMENGPVVLDSKDIVLRTTGASDAVVSSRSTSPNISKMTSLEEKPSPRVIPPRATGFEGTVSKTEPDENAFEEELLSLVDGDVKTSSASVPLPAAASQLQADSHVQPQAPSHKTSISGSNTPTKPKAKARAAPKASKAKLITRPDSAALSPQPSKPTAARNRTNKSGGTGGSRRKANVARARSQSVKPSEDTPVPEPEPEPQIEKLYCVCKQPYEEDRVMIACDRCDEWYHPTCVGMPESEVDLVDQFICVNCTKHDPSLRTTYKTRCFRGLHHIASHDNNSPCWKPARGAFSKYCSDTCGISHMRAKIAKAGHDPAELWPVLKSARKREGVTIEHPSKSKKRKVENLAETAVIKTEGGGDKMDVDAGERANAVVSGAIGQTNSLAHIRRLHESIDAREVASLKQHLASTIRTREECKSALDRVATRRRLLDLAVERASERFCGWDARLEMGDSEWADWVDTPAGRKALAGEEGEEDEEASSWWCQISEYCQRHVDWQRVRDIEMQLEVDSKNASIKQLTDKERDLRRRIEELDPTARAAKATKRRKSNK